MAATRSAVLIQGDGKGYRALASRFRGEFDQRVDSKGRMSIPARFRRVIEAQDPEFPDTPQAQVMLNYGAHLSDYMCAYSIETFEEIEDRILDMEEDDEKDMLQQLYITQSLICEVDKDGRIVIPKELRDRFDLSGDVKVRGLGDHFQIWPRATAETRTTALLSEMLSDKPDNFKPLKLLPKKNSRDE